jgi:hypothetical protein
MIHAGRAERALRISDGGTFTQSITAFLTRTTTTPDRHKGANMSLRTTLIVAIAWACVSLAQAADQPTDGFLYNTGGSSGLRYSCNTLRFDEIVCEFTQTSLRRRADPKDLQKELQNARAQFASVKLPSGDACSGYKKLLNTLKTGDTSGMPDPAEASQKFKVMSAGEKKALTEIVSAVASFCRVPSEKNYLNIVKTDFLKRTRTCLATAQTFKQTFKRVEMSDTWASNEGPTDACGTAYVSRFEADKSAPFFRYVTRKIVTRPQGEMLMGLQCSDLDTTEYTYDWQSKVHYLPCDFIDFSPL